MIIAEQDFRLTPTDTFSNRFDVELLYKVKPKTGEAHEEFKNVAYAVNLEYALKLIINYRVQKKAKDAALTMKQFLYLYTKELNYVKEIIKQCASGNDSILEGVLTDSVKDLQTTIASTSEDAATAQP